MITCPNGHPNPDEAEFCQVCHAYLRWDLPPPATPPAGPEPDIAGEAGSLAPAQVSVEPGQQASSDLTIRNTGTIVDRYSLAVHSGAASWITVDPGEVSLLPGASQTVQVAFHPLRSPDVPAGPTEFAIAIESAADPNASITVQGVVDVRVYFEVSATIVPTRSEGRRSGGHDVILVNQGNAQVSLGVAASDPDGVLVLDVAPPTLTVDRGAQGQAKLTARPRKPILIGRAKPHPFKVSVEPVGSAAITVDGTMLQRPILPWWLLPLVAAVIALIRAAGGAGVVVAILLVILTPVAKRIISRRYAGELVPGHSTTGQGPEEQPVTPYQGITAGLAPRTSSGRRSAEHVLSVQNAGGTPFTATLAAADREGFLAFEIQPPNVTAQAGGTASATLRVRPRKRILLSGARPRPFQVLVSPVGGAPFAVDGTMIQERFIPLWLLPFTGLAVIVLVLAALLVIAIAVAVLWLVTH